MMENPELGDMNSGSFETSGAEEKSENTQKVSVSNQTNSSSQYPNIKSDSLNLDIERFSRLATNDFTTNSRLTRNLSRKGSQRGVEKKMNSSADNERRDASILVPNSSSPRAPLFVGTRTPEKPIIVTVGATNHPDNQQIHHQITITTPATTASATATESKVGGKRLSFKRSSSSARAIDPRRILFFFATLSSMGTMLLIYFTLSMGKLSGEDNIID